MLGHRNVQIVRAVSIASRTKKQLARLGQSSKRAVPKAKQALKHPRKTAIKLVKTAAEHPAEVAAVAGVAGLALGANRVTRHCCRARWLMVEHAA